LLFYCYSLTNFGQNLVPDGGFEVYKTCPESMRPDDKNIFLIPHWTWPTVDGTTDYFNSCSSSGITGIPKNSLGYAPAMNGRGYIGTILKSHAQGADYREYIQAKLKAPLKKDQIYCVSLFYRLADCSSFSIDRMGILFQDKEVKVATSKVINFSPQIENPKNIFMENSNEWKPLYNMYVANGSEQYIVIGNFNIDDDTKEKQRKRPEWCDKRKDYAYYYIDSVQVMELHWNCEPCPCVPQDLKITIEKDECFNGGSNLFANITGGTIPYRKFKWDDNKNNPFYIHALTGNHKCSVVDDWGCNAKSEITIDCGQPLTAKIISKGYKANSTGFANIEIKGGIPPYKFAWSSGSTEQNPKNLALGFHKVTITDSQEATASDSLTFKLEAFNVTHTSSYSDGNDGTIRIHILGGLPPYSILWNNGDTTSIVKNLSAGTYTYTVYDSEKRAHSETIQFIEPLKVSYEKGYTFETDGYVNLNIKGGCPPYKVKWSNDSIGTNVKYLDNGVYKFNIECSCGKLLSDTVRIKGSIVLNNVLFETGKATLLPSSYPELDKVVKYLKRKTKVRVEISGHTDSEGSDVANLKLSDDRAKSVVEYIVSQGVPTTNLVSKGYGETKPVATNDTPEGRQRNRRVEFNIVE